MPSFPRRVSPDGRYFLDQEGRPFFWLGDTAWALFSRYPRPVAEAYLAHRGSLGFTVVQAVLVWPAHIGTGPEPPGTLIAGGEPWLGDDPGRPNPSYFANVDHLLDVAAGYGLTLALLPAWGTFTVDAKLLNPQNAFSYGHWLGQRYRERPNLVWVNGGDCLPQGYEDVFHALAAGLRQGDGGAHLMSYHPCGWYSSSLYFHHADWLDFNMIQTWTDWTRVYDAVAADSWLAPAKPVVLGEGAYEDGPEYPRGPITPLIVRRQAWWACMAGGYYTYGWNQNWRTEPGWEACYALPGAAQMGILAATLARYRWWERVPDQGLFQTGAGSGATLNAGVRGSDNRWAMLYFGSQCHAQVRLGRLSTPVVHATWVNPATGEERDAGEHQAYEPAGVLNCRLAHHPWFSTPDFWEDAVLLLDGRGD